MIFPMKPLLRLVSLLSCLLVPGLHAASPLLELVTKAGDSATVVGRDGWLYFAPELKHLAAGEFWGEKAASVTPGALDPLPAILEFHRQLKARGIELIVMPVPAKASIQSEGLPAPAQPADGASPAVSSFLKVLADQGVSTLDLTGVFTNAVARPLYCKQDTHWNGEGIRRAAEALAVTLRSRPYFPMVKREAPVFTPLTLDLQGDLWQALPEPRPAKESITLAKPEGVEIKKADSPVLLLGDSHLLVFSAGGDLHATGAGFPETLAAVTGVSPDVLAVRGSGALVTRDLVRKAVKDPTWLASKKVVVWCFTSREFTQATGAAWKPVPFPAPKGG